ncbi:hypothetical protein HYR99_22540 [Candidatus Poribacteria bacterium]|nr:hypothetical protein [Candidatus Poribacteria bacterium]
MSPENRKTYSLFCGVFSALLVAMLGCSTGEIDNFEDIRIESDYRLDRLELQIVLLNENGNPLYWDQSILTPQIGVSVLSESKFKTNAKVYSMRNGIKHTKVYDGRLIDLRWSSLPEANIRLFRAEIPHGLITEDPQRDTEMGIITVTLETDKQGPFSDTLENTRIYSGSVP